MVLRLGEALGVPLRERNQLLAAAGLAPAYPETPVTAAELAPYRAAIEQLLRAHQPYPAMVVDAHWCVVFANDACAAVFGGGVVGVNLVRRMIADPAAGQAIVNWAEVAWAGLARLRQQLGQAPLDEELRALVAGSATRWSALSGSRPVSTRSPRSPSTSCASSCSIRSTQPPKTSSVLARAGLLDDGVLIP
jgi:transcription regulator MmyB-like protein